MKRSRFVLSAAVLLFFSAEIFPDRAYAEEPIPAAVSGPAQFIPQDKKEAVGPNRVFLVDDFNHLHSLNLMGGITQGKEEEPGGLIPSFTPSGPFTMGRLGHSLKMDYNVQLPASIAFYWSRFGPLDPDSGPGASFPMNLTGFNYLSFWLKSAKEYPRFAVEIHRDANSDHRFTLGKDANSKIAVSSFILQPTDAISGNTAEAVISLTDKESVAQSPPHPAAMTETVDAPKTEAAPAAAEAPKQPETVTYKPLSRRTASGEPQRRSQKKKFFYYTEKTLSPQEQEAEKALIKPAATQAEKEAEKALVKPGAPQNGGVVSQVLGSGKGGKVVMAPERLTTIKEQKARWRKVVVPLSRFQLVNDWSSILEMVLVFDNRLGSDQGIAYIDDITFGTNYVAPTPQFSLKTRMNSLKFSPARKGMSAAAVRAVEMGSRQEENLAVRSLSDQAPSAALTSERLSEVQKIARERIKRLFEWEHPKDLAAGMAVPGLILLTFTVTPPEEPGLESIRIEVSNNGGKTWNIAASLYNHQGDGEYYFPWRVPATGEDAVLELRLVASDIWGRSLPISDPASFKRETGK